jgi:glycosyltransferase involved in cell wall biosynthesis
MHLLFIHQAFPAQFGQLGLELHRRYGWQCTFIVQHLSRCPTPSLESLQRLTIIRVAREKREGPPPWMQSFSEHMALSATVHEALRSRAAQLRPDLVVSHCGLGPALSLRDLFSCPIVNYCEYYLGVRHRDLTYRVDLPPVELAPFYPRCINAPALLGLTDAPAGYTPTHWQRSSFPKRFQAGIEVHFDGLDTQMYRPGLTGDLSALLGGRSLPRGARVVTFVARGLESMRGFDLFMQVADRLGKARSDVLFVIVGGDEAYYGWDALFTGRMSFRQWVISRGNFDLTRFAFLGQVEPDQLALLLARSDLHLYLTVPFVLSWSLFNALSCGAVVLASDVAPVREVIEPGINGLVAPLFDIERLTATALQVLNDPAAFRALGDNARSLMENRYSLDASIPALKDYFERQIVAWTSKSVRTSLEAP